MKTYLIGLGGRVYRQRGKSTYDAAARAIRRKKPKSLGMLVTMQPVGGVKFYWNAREAVKRAGFKVSRSK